MIGRTGNCQLCSCDAIGDRAVRDVINVMSEFPPNIAAGQFIINNVSWTILFGMKRDAAYRLVDHYKDEILPSHAEFLARMGSDDQHGKGMAVVRANGKADMVYFQLRPIEAEYLFGS